MTDMAPRPSRAFRLTHDGDHHGFLNRRRLLTFAVTSSLGVTAACGAPRSGTPEASRGPADADPAPGLMAVRDRIEQVLKADAETGSRRDPAARAAAMRAIDMAGCPPDFAAAYLNHIFAWEYAARLEAALAQRARGRPESANAARTPSGRLLDQEASADLDEARQLRRLEALRGQAHAEIRSTFQRVQRIATGYGATLPD